jgi:hypothetical protein
MASGRRYRSLVKVRVRMPVSSMVYLWVRAMDFKSSAIAFALWLDWLLNLDRETMIGVKVHR